MSIDPGKPLSLQNMTAETVYKAALSLRFDHDKQLQDVLLAIYQNMKHGRLTADQLLPSVVEDLRGVHYCVELFKRSCTKCCKHTTKESKYYWVITWDMCAYNEYLDQIQQE